MLPPEDTMVPLSWKMRLPPGHFWAPHTTDPTGKKKKKKAKWESVIYLCDYCVTTPDYQGEIGYSYTMQARWRTSNSKD